MASDDSQNASRPEWIKVASDNRLSKAGASAAALAVLLFLFACLRPDSDPSMPMEPPPAQGPGTETGNPGLVQDAQGLRLAGVTVRLWSSPQTALDPSGQPQAYRLFDSVVSDSTGRIRFRPAEEGLTVLEAVDRRADLGRAIPAVKRPNGDTSVLRLVLRTLSTLHGTVTRGGPWPVPGLADDAGILVQLLEIGRMATTPANGSFRFEAVPAGSYTLAAYALDGHFSPLFRGNIVLSPDTILDLDTLRLLWSPAVKPPPVLGVRAAWDTAAQAGLLTWSPVALADLAGYILWSAAPGQTLAPFDTLAKESLAYSLPLDPGQGSLADTLHFAVTCFDSAGNAGPLPDTSIRLIPYRYLPTEQGWVSGKVLLSNGQPASGALVKAFWLPAPDTGRAYLADTVRWMATVSADDRGFYRLSLPRAKMIIEASSSAGMAEATPAPLKAMSPYFIPENAESVLDDLVLGETGHITGTLSRGGLCVACQKENGFLFAWSRQGPHVAASNAQGVFTLKGLPVGYHDLVLYGTPEGWFYPKLRMGIQVMAGATTVLALDTLAYDSTQPPPAPRWLETRYDSLNQTVTLSWEHAPTLGATQTRAKLTRRQGMPPKPETIQSFPAGTNRAIIDLSTLPAGLWFDFVLQSLDSRDSLSQGIASPAWRR